MRYTDLDPILLDLAREGRTWKKAIARVVQPRIANRFLWQRPDECIHPTKEIISVCYYNRNETETVVADQLKQASNDYVLLGLAECTEITLNTPAYRLKSTLLLDRCQRSR